MHLSYWICNQFTLHHKFRIDTGRTNFGQGKTDSILFTAVNLMDKEHKDPYEIDLNAPRFASYKQKKWKGHQDTVYWVDIQLAQRKALKFYQTRCNAIIPYDALPAYCISKVVVMECGEFVCEEIYESLRPPPRFPSKTIGWKNWIQKSLDAAKTPKESNQKQKPNYQEREDPWVDKNPPRRSRKMSCLVTRTSSTQQERGDPSVD